MVPARSETSKSAKSVFFEDVNDIDIFIEDTAIGFEKIYAILFSRVFSDAYSVEKVFPLGGRDSVINRHGKHVNTGRPAIYIIDGDMFFLTGGGDCSALGLFVLPFYCIDNLLCDPDAFEELMYEEDPTHELVKIKDLFDYSGWVGENSDKLFDLFVEYGISFTLNPAVPTVSYPVNKLVACSRGNLAADRLEERIREVKDATIDAVGQDQYDAERQRIVSSHNLTGAEILKAVSGKDYLFPLLKMRARSTVKTRVPDINLKIRIAKVCDVSDLASSKDYIVK